MSYLESLRKAAAVTLTENGGKAYDSTLDPCLDFFGLGASKREDPEGAVRLFLRAYNTDALVAIRTLFYIRDIRGGQGERDTFRYCLTALLANYPDTFEKVINYIPEYGRWDDLLVIPGAVGNAAAVALVKKQLDADLTAPNGAPISLLGKWMPSENASSRGTKALAKLWATALGYKSIRNYRKDVVKLRKRITLLETYMSRNAWGSIQYGKLPSQAMRKHVNAFFRHDEDRYAKFLREVTEGKNKINTATLSTDDVFQSVENNARSEATNVIWNSLENVVPEGTNGLVMADVSGSMCGRPMRICTSLALYFAERNKGAFANTFLTFSARPQLVEICGDTLEAKLRNIENADWAMNTNIERAFDVLLNTAVKTHAKQEELPDVLYVISDMEFDGCVNGADETAFENATRKWAEAGYKLPHVVFWNVDARNNHLPATVYSSNVTLISGSNQSAFKYAVGGKSPRELMDEVVNCERYAQIVL